MKRDLIIKSKYILTMNEKMDVFNNGAVVIAGEKIIEVGSDDIIRKYPDAKIIDYKNSIVMPGFVNTHTHAAMTYFRGLADDLPLDDWLNRHIWPAEAECVNPKFVRKYSELACLEMLKAGITCFNDMYFFEEETAAAADQAGMRAFIGEGILDFPTPSSKNADEALLRTEELILKYKNNSRILVTLAPHSIYACSKENLFKARKQADKYSVPLHIHISETKKELDDCRRDRGMTPVAYLDSLGILDEKTIAAHSIWLTDADLEIYQKRGVNIAHCPISNMKLGSGIMPYEKMRKFGLDISLASDGAASNNTLDIFSEMRVCALLHKVSNLEPEAAPAVDAVKAATINGAKALGAADRIGSLEAGKLADLITINLDRPHLTPIYNPYSHLAYAVNAADVDNVIINGKVVVENRKVVFLDEEKILAGIAC